MAISFDKAVGFHEKALHFRVQRSEVLANNLVNGDTPGFKARDMNFASVLQGQMTGATRMLATHKGHIAPSLNDFSHNLMYRVPMQPSLDGNTVEENIEMAKFTENNLQFQASFEFLNKRFKGMKNAISGDS